MHEILMIVKVPHFTLVSLLFVTAASGLFSLHWRRIVLDEAHTIKNSSTEAAKACYMVRRKKHRREKKEEEKREKKKSEKRSEEKRKENKGSQRRKEKRRKVGRKERRGGNRERETRERKIGNINW